MLAYLTSAWTRLVFWFIFSTIQYYRLKGLFTLSLQPPLSHPICPVKWLEPLYYPSCLCYTKTLNPEVTCPFIHSSSSSFLVRGAEIINHTSAVNISRSPLLLSTDAEHLVVVTWAPCYQGWPTALFFEAVSYLSGFLNFYSVSIDTDRSLQKPYQYNFSHILWQLTCKCSSYFHLSCFPDVYVLHQQALFSETTSLLLLTSYPSQVKSYILLTICLYLTLHFRHIYTFIMSRLVTRFLSLNICLNSLSVLKNN